jgi:dihydrolipoamide dehydrogenase
MRKTGGKFMVMGQLTTNVDVAVIGGGPGGYTAAIRAAQLGLDVALIEENRLGGVCTNVGCIPSKALIHAADVKHNAETADSMGMKAEIKLDYAKTQEWKQKVVDSLVNGIETLCKLNGVEVIKGRAFFQSSDSLLVESHGTRTIKFRKAIIATGTRIKELEGLPYDHEKVIDSDDALSLKEVPKRMLIYGGGYIAVEMTNMYQKLGSQVTVIYRGPRLLKTMEPEISELLAKEMARLGVKIMLNSTVQRTEGSTAVVKTEKGEEKIEFDKLLLAIGRTNNLGSLGLEKTKARVENGLVVVDSTMKTGDDNIYAVGDIVYGPALAHKAFRQGKVAAEAIAGMKSGYDNVVPMVVFSHPEIASVGMTEEQARKLGNVKTGKMQFSASGKAKAMNRKDGFVKIIADDNNIILGVHIIGPEAGTLVAEAAFAIENASRLEDLALTIHAHPTLPETLMEAAEDALGQAIHLYRKKEA